MNTLHSMMNNMGSSIPGEMERLSATKAMAPSSGHRVS